MTFAHHLVDDYFRRTGRPGDGALDGAYQFEVAILRDMLDRLEAILDDEGVERATAERVLRCLLYGAPSPAAAEARMRREVEMGSVLRHMPPLPVTVPGHQRAAALGLAERQRQT